jgi:hypothetical protein
MAKMNFTLKNFAVVLIFQFICISAPIVAFENQQNNSIIINVKENVDLNAQIKGTTKQFFYNEQIIKFEIICSYNKKIRITKNTSIENSDVIINADWKAGPYTGFENEFIDNDIYTLDNFKYYVTIKIKSVKILPTAIFKNYNFYPEIRVEYID